MGVNADPFKGYRSRIEIVQKQKGLVRLGLEEGREIGGYLRKLHRKCLVEALAFGEIAEYADR